MLGFLLGIGATLFVIHRVRHGGPLGRSSRRGRRRRRDWILDRLSSRLDTSPSQENVLADVIDDLFDTMGEERSILRGSRQKVADLLRTDAWDAEAAKALRGEHEAALDRVQGTLNKSLQTLHETLDPEQRGHLADLLERGPRHHHGRCHHRRRHLHAA